MKKNVLHSPFLISTKVYLRPVEVSDATIIKQWHNDPELRKLGSGGGYPTTIDREEEDIKSATASPDGVYLMIVKKSGNKEVGFIRANWLTSVDGNVWLRMIIGDKRAWGTHIARDALQCFLNWLFNDMNIHRVTCETYATNKRAIAFFRIMGFRREGILREAHFADGAFHDVISFGLLKKEFKGYVSRSPVSKSAS